MATKITSSTALNGKENTNPATRASQRKRTKVTSTDARVQVEPRAKTGRQSKAGRLSQLISMPMDILMEIFGHLHPLDLLHLARTTKAFRRVLMHKSSTSVWKAARATVQGLPDCLPDMSEPQWANLAFDTHCHFCSRSNIRIVDWILRIRICNDCTRTHIVDWSYYDIDDDVADVLLSIIPTRRGKRRRREFLKNEAEKIRTQYCAIEDRDAIEAFLLERQQVLKRIEEHAELCVVWASAQAHVRSNELDRLRSNRQQAITEKLVALGWGDEIDNIPPYDSLANHRLVKAPQLLTERIWKNIERPMIEYMEKMKANRLARELAQLHTQRKLGAIKLLKEYKAGVAPFTDVMPEPLDFCAFSPIKEILDQPPEVDVDSESFLHLVPELDGMVKEWRQSVVTKFVQEVKTDMVNRSIVLDDNLLDAHASDEAILQRIPLACIVFTCFECEGDRCFDDELFSMPDYMFNLFRDLALCTQSPMSKPLWYPRVLGHRCFTKPEGYNYYADEAMKFKELPYHRQKWSCASMAQVDEAACKAAVTIVKACGMDPKVATVDEMDALDTRVECLECLIGQEEDPCHIVFGWRSAVKHQCEFHRDDPGGWRMLTASEVELAREDEEKWANIIPQYVLPSDRKVWLCLHCLDLPSEKSWKTIEDVRDHIEVCHYIEVPQINHDYVKDFAAPELYATSTLFQACVVKFPE